MNSAKGILKFNFSGEKMLKYHGRLIPAHVQHQIDRCIRELEHISERIGEGIYDGVAIDSMRQVVLKFKTWSVEEGRDWDFFNKRELRTLSFALDFKTADAAILEDPLLLENALDLLDRNWRDAFISGLLHCYFANWGDRRSKCFGLLSSFIFRKIGNYNGTRKVLLNVKTNLRYYDRRKGDVELGTFMALNGIPLSKMTRYLNVPENWISYPYFFGVIAGFVERSKNQLEQNLKDIEETLRAHSNGVPGTIANKIVVSRLICYAEQLDPDLQDQIKDVAFDLVGDPESSQWSRFHGANQKDAETLIRAKRILNEWVTRQFITVFFEKCINDPRRKRFWLKYSKNIGRFKVFGSASLKHSLLQDKRISKYVLNRFEVVRGESQISAFMFSMENYRMIEFSETGYAFYAYKDTNPHAPQFEIAELKTVDSFRDGSMPFLVHRSGFSLHSFSEEGRLTHNDHTLTWEEVFENWIQTKVGVYV